MSTTQRSEYVDRLLVDELRGLLGRPLLKAEADRAETLAAVLGVKLEWTHKELTGREWRPGRGQG